MLTKYRYFFMKFCSSASNSTPNKKKKSSKLYYKIIYCLKCIISVSQFSYEISHLNIAYQTGSHGWSSTLSFFFSFFFFSNLYTKDYQFRNIGLVHKFRYCCVIQNFYILYALVGSLKFYSRFYLCYSVDKLIFSVDNLNK